MPKIKIPTSPPSGNLQIERSLPGKAKNYHVPAEVGVTLPNGFKAEANVRVVFGEADEEVTGTSALESYSAVVFDATTLFATTDLG